MESKQPLEAIQLTNTELELKLSRSDSKASVSSIALQAAPPNIFFTASNENVKEKKNSASNLILLY